MLTPLESQTKWKRYVLISCFNLNSKNGGGGVPSTRRN